MGSVVASPGLAGAGGTVVAPGPAAFVVIGVGGPIVVGRGAGVVVVAGTGVPIVGAVAGGVAGVAPAPGVGGGGVVVRPACASAQFAQDSSKKKIVIRMDIEKPRKQIASRGFLLQSVCFAQSLKQGSDVYPVDAVGGNLSGRFGLALVLGGLRTFFQSLAVPDPALAAVAGQLEILRQFQRVGGTRILAQPAEHAAAQIVSEIGEFFSARFLVTLARDHNQVLRTRQCTQVAGDAHGLVGIWIDVQPGRSAVALGHSWPLQRILLGIDLFRILVAEGDFQSLQQVNQENFAKQARHTHAA
jgi:hypothetical protein